ncbi:peptidoglycan-binding domain-containing protein, partial [Deinococcus aetherius]
AVQKELGVTADGQFGPQTKSAVVSFQQSRGLTADGIVGPNTWRELVGSGTVTTSDRATLAQQILNNGRISLYTVQVSGVNDGADARSNIVDTAAGRPAKRSSYDNAPGGSVYLDTRMLRGMLSTAGVYSYRSTAIAGGSHSSNSRHYAGLAFDVDTINGVRVSSSNPYFRNFMQACRNAGADEVLGPGSAGHSTHVHCGWPR